MLHHFDIFDACGNSCLQKSVCCRCLSTRHAFGLFFGPCILWSNHRVNRFLALVRCNWNRCHPWRHLGGKRLKTSKLALPLPHPHMRMHSLPSPFARKQSSNWVGRRVCCIGSLQAFNFLWLLLWYKNVLYIIEMFFQPRSWAWASEYTTLHNNDRLLISHLCLIRILSKAKKVSQNTVVAKDSFFVARSLEVNTWLRQLHGWQPTADTARPHTKPKLWTVQKIKSILQ